MRKVRARKVRARVVLDISYLLAFTYSQGQEQCFFADRAENLLKAYIGNAFSIKGIDYEEVEFVILTHSAYEPERAFKKTLSAELSEIISYEQLEQFISGKNHLEYVWKKAEKLPAISNGEIILLRLTSWLEQQVDAREIKRSLRDLSCLFKAAEPHPRDTNAQTAFDFLSFCLKKTETNTAVSLTELNELLNALKFCGPYFSQIPELFNPRELLYLDKDSSVKIPTFLVLSPFTRTLDNFPGQFFATRTYRTGEADKTDLAKLDATLTAHRENPFVKTIVHLDFDRSTCRNDLVQHGKNIAHAVNPDIVDMSKRIQNAIPNARFEILTARRPWHVGVKELFSLSATFFTNMHKFKIPHDDDLRTAACEANNELDDIIRKKHPLHEEIHLIRALCAKVETLKSVSSTFIFETVEEHERPVIQSYLDSIEYQYATEISKMEHYCVSRVTRLYEQKHSVTIAISNESHLSHSEAVPRFKGDFIYNRYKRTAQRTLVILADDSEVEIEDLTDKTERLPNTNTVKLYGNKNVDVVSIQIQSDGVLVSDYKEVFDRFLQAVDAPKKRKQPTIFDERIPEEETPGSTPSPSPIH